MLVPDYRYKTPPFKGIIEHEFCPIYSALTVNQPKLNLAEVSEYEWLEWDKYKRRASADDDNSWSWWCKDQLRLLVPTVG